MSSDSQQAAPRPEDSGVAAVNQFIIGSRHEVYPALDATKVKLSRPFVVCVVDASRGIGAGIAFSYAKAGASGLILASRRTSGLEDTAAKCKSFAPGIEVEIVSCDITSSESVVALAKTTKVRFGRLDVVAVNSGYSGTVVLKVTETDPDTFQNAINVNYVGTFLCAKYLIPLLLATEGGAKAFIAVSSLAALLIRGEIANTQYCVSKAAQLKFMEHIHEQYAEEGLSSFSVHPGAVPSEMADDTAPESFRKYLIDSPELCGAFIVSLTKDMSKSAWMRGRLLSANWDIDELGSKKDEIMEKDLLKLKLAV